jgi:DNA recombination protein RmuC
LSDNRYVVVDSKTLQFSTKPLEAFDYELSESEDSNQEASLSVLADAKSLVRSIKSAVEDLSKKNYTGQNVNETPDFVVLFLPQESMLSHALEEDPSLWEWAWQKQVLLSSPLTLIALLRMIAVGWNQKKMTENLLAVMEVGKKIHERVILMAERLVKIENQYATLGKTVEDLRKTYDGNRGLVKAVNELEELGVSSNKSLPEELKEAPYKLDALLT